MAPESARSDDKPARSTSGSGAFPIVGIGASAGGLEAFSQLLRHLPVDSGMAFVLVQHLDPKHESRLAGLLARTTRLPVLEVSDRCPVQPDHVYVIPPNTVMTLSEDGLHLAPRNDVPGQHLPIDHFFKSLAEQRQTASIGVVLSGNGSDGTVGLEEIKAAGGITFAQNESASFSGMPKSAIGSGCVDFVLAPDEIARELARIGRHPYVRPAPADAPSSEVGDAFRGIVELLRSSTGVDFGAYRDTTIQRRIKRRMLLLRRERLADYLEHLRGDRAELDALYHDILISVTSFFRGPETFEALKHAVFPAIFKMKTSATPIRFWVPGCSTGQEAYSLAMVLLEFLDDRPFRPPIQIFATDLSDAVSLHRAREGEYPGNIEAEVSPERLRRFFSKQGDRYRIDKTIRDSCVFAKQNVAADPPFSRVDLVSCRNLLIYLSPILQRRVIPTFHYSLNPGGFLLLGASESVGSFSDLFTPVDHRHRIYVKNVSAGRQYPHFSAAAVSGLSAAVSHAGAPSISAGDWQREADRLALGQYAPPGVLVNDGLEVLQLRGHTGPYLALAPGEPSFKLLKMAREGLLFDLRAALAECRERNALARRTGVRVLGDEGDVREIELQVMPVTLPGTPERCFLVQFVSRPAGEPGAAADGPAAESSDSLADPAAATAAEREVVGLRQELNSTREYLESVIEQQDASHEELRSANEEILSANEELQSTNEELETAKEELQSVNEELTTVNEQLQIRNAELARLDDDATNLFTSANVPMVVVGVDLRLRRYTAAAGKLLDLGAIDVGRPLITLRLPVDVPDLEPMAEEVIDRVEVREREVLGRDGRMYTLRIHPYRTADKRIDGAVIVLVDIDELAHARALMALAHDQLQAVVDTVWEPLVVLDAHSRVVSANRRFYEKFGVTSGEIDGRLLFDLADGRWDVAELRQQLDEIRLRGTELRELEVAVELEGVRRIFLLNARRLSAGPDGPEHILLAFDEVTERRRMEVGLRLQRDELVTAGHRKDEFLAMLAHELRNPLGPMRHPVSTLRGKEGRRGAMARDVVDGAILPAAPEDAGPGAGEDADGVGMAAAAGAGALVDERRPPRGVPRVIRERGEGLAQAFVACPAEDDGPVLAGRVGDGREAGLGGELRVRGEARAIIAELREDLGGVDGTAAGQALEQRTIGMLRQRGGDGRGELLDVGDEGREDGDEGADDLAARLSFGLPDLTGRSPAEAGQQLRHGAPATVGVLAEELGEAAFGEPGGAVGRGVAGEEGQRDRRVDLGEDDRGPRPETLEEGAELIGEGDALGDKLLPAAHEGAHRPRLVRGGMQRPEALAVGPQQVGEDEGIARVTLAAGGGVAWPARLEGVGVDGHHLQARVEQGIHEQARGAFEGDAEGAAAAEAVEAAAELAEPLGGVRDGALPVDAGGLVDHADRVGLTGPVDTDEELHCLASGDGETLRRERSCRSLTDWRSGLLGHVARHPVAGRGLSCVHSGERVSSWPSSGERCRLSPNVGIAPQHARARRPRPRNAIVPCLQDRRSCRRPYLGIPLITACLTGRVVQ